MSSNRDFERRIADFYAQEGLLRAPDRVLTSALTTIENTPQRRVFGRLFGPVSWRFHDMNRFLMVAGAAIALVVAVSVGYVLFSGRTPTTGVPSTQLPSPSLPSLAPSLSAQSSPSVTSPPSLSPSSPALTPSGSGLALTETYSSDVHGITVNYPAGWHLQPATEPWTTDSGGLTQESPFADVIYQQEIDTPFIAVASQPLGSQTAAEWETAYLASLEQPCGTTEPYSIDRSSGVIIKCGDGAYAVVTVGGRGHVIWLYRIDDLEWFKQILDTVQLNPESAYGPALTETYSSDVHGITVNYPAGWHLQPATEPWTTDSGGLTQESPFADVIYQQEIDTPFIAVASQPLGSQTAAEWETAYLASLEQPCGTTEPYSIDRSSGVIIKCGDGAYAVVTVGDRGHVIWLYRLDNMAWFKDLLDTVQLKPRAALGG